MLISTFGDIVAQKVLESRPAFDYGRNGVVSCYGFFETIIEGHFWFGLLEKVFGPSQALKVSLLKTAADQLFFSPLEMTSFMVWTHTIEQQKAQTLLEKLNADLPTTIITSYMFWLPASLFNFYVVPYPLRAGFTGLMCVAWDTFMSFASHNRLKESLRKGEVVN